MIVDDVHPGAFSDVFAAAVARRGVSLTWLHRRLVASGNPVSLAALSYWRTGRSQPESVASRAALPVLEELLDLPPNTLVSRLGASRRQGRVAPPKLPAELLIPAQNSSGGAAAPVEIDDFAHTVECSTHAIMYVDDAGMATSIHYRTVWRSLVDGLSVVPSVFTVDQPGPGVPTLRAVAGCSVRVRKATSGTGIVLSELVLEEPLLAGQHAVTDYVIEDLPPSNSEEHYYEHYATRRMTEVMIGVRFHPDRLPVHVEARTDEIETGIERVSVLTSRESVTHVVAHFGPGRTSVHWYW